MQSIEHVSDTARWVAIYRAIESERPDAHFRDPFARPLAGRRGEEIVRSIPRALSWGWPMVVRTVLMDELILKAVREGGCHTVLNLASGLDARPFRMQLPAELRWVDVDFPDVIAYKREQLAAHRPVCRLEFEGVDLSSLESRRALFTRVREAARRVLVVSEGLLVYLKPEEVASLAADLRAEPTFRFWLTDIASPRILAMMKRMWSKHLERGRAEMHFAPAEGTAFFVAHGWRELEFRSMWENALRLKRTMRLAWLWKLLTPLISRKRREEMRRMSGVALLEPI